jgi:SP family general alpha glucoside:H+ symporter-like MFS transporter
MNQSEKPEVVLDDNVAADDVTKDEAFGLVKSRFDELSIPRTLWVFRRVVLVSLAVYTGYVCEGFEVSQIQTSKMDQRSIVDTYLI